MCFTQVDLFADAQDRALQLTACDLYPLICFVYAFHDFADYALARCGPAVAPHTQCAQCMTSKVVQQTTQRVLQWDKDQCLGRELNRAHCSNQMICAKVTACKQGPLHLLSWPTLFMQSHRQHHMTISVQSQALSAMLNLTTSCL